MLKHFFIVFIIVSSLIFPQTDSSKTLTLTLEEALKIAVEKNWDVQLAEQDIRKAEEQINEAYANAFPRVDFTGRYIRNIKLPVMFLPPNSLINPTSQTQTFELGSKNSFDFGLTLSQVIYNQKVNTAIKIADEYASLSKTASIATRNQISYAVKSAFYATMLMQELVKVSQTAFQVSEATFNNISALYKQGVASEFDYLRSEVQVANTQPALIQAQNSLEMAKNALKNLLNIDLNKPIEIKGSFVYQPLTDEEIADAGEEAIKTNPLIKQLEIQESLLEQNEVIEKSEYFPSLALFSAYNWQTQDNTFKFKNFQWAESFSVGLQLNYTVFDGFKRGARIEQVKIDRQKVTLNRMKLTEGLKIQILQASLKMQEARKRIEAQEKSLLQADRAMKIAQTRYQNGVGTQLEIIDTQAALSFAQTNYAQAIYDYLIAKSEWEYSVSKD